MMISITKALVTIIAPKFSRCFNFQAIAQGIEFLRWSI
jgi:hypothetical protein